MRRRLLIVEDDPTLRQALTFNLAREGYEVSSSSDGESADAPENTMAAAEKWAAGLGAPAYAIDDETAIKVVDDTVEVVSEGHWKLFTP